MKLERSSWKTPVQVSKEAEGVHILVPKHQNDE
jgi:hypothetical protein